MTDAPDASAAHRRARPYTDVPAHPLTIPNGRRGRAAVALAFAAAAVALVPLPARAEYGPGAEAVSASGALLGSAASTLPSISDDGRYVVFATLATALLGQPQQTGETYRSGIVRRDMLTGAVEVVAPAERVRRGDGVTLTPASIDPSISGNGRYVLFTTPLALAAGDANTSNDVYVRDMSIGLTDASAYELVSALDGTDGAPTYTAGGSAGSRGGRRGFALSDDGRRAVFRTEAGSNLPAGGAMPAPASQVLVRLLDSRTTLLVSRDRSDSTLPGTPVQTGVTPTDPVLSGDGTAVSWVGANVAAQAQTLPGEPPAPGILWRDITAGPGAPARRVAGTSDPGDPDCPAGSAFPQGGSASTGPCFGPFVASEALNDSSGPQETSLSISDDGTRVLFLSAAQQRPFDARTAGNIAYLADMTPGVARKEGVRRIVRVPGTGMNVDEVVLAGAGTRLALASSGRAFEGPRAVGAFPVGDPPTRNAYVVDLVQGIVQRATVGADGADFRGVTPDPSDGAIRDPALGFLAVSDDAGALAFSASDGNLFIGDANDAVDVQVVRGTPGLTIARSAFPAPVAPPGSTSGGGGEAIRPIVSLVPDRVVFGHLDVDGRGVARMTVRVPAAGRLIATASARGKRLRVARTSRRLKRATTVHLRLGPTLAARAAARRARRLKVRIDVRYTPVKGRASSVVRGYTLTRSAAR